MVNKWRKGFLAMVALGLAGATVGVQPAAAKELSDKSVKVLMDYAWLVLPSKFRTPDRRVIEVDKKTQKDQVLVPIDVGRDVIKVGYTSAQAQLCEMWEEQSQNYKAMIHVQRAKHPWTDQQLLYITTLHRMTIHMAAGKLKVSEKDGEQVVILEPIEPSKTTCDDAKRKIVKDAVAAQIAAAAAVKVPAKAAAPAGATPAAQAVPTSQKQ